MIAIILAGGSGTRFWPLSRQAHPKQLLQLWGNRPMIGETFERLAGYTPKEKIFVVCGKHLQNQVQDALPDLAPENLIVEPEARNTAPAIALATAFAKARFGEEVVGIFPSDHYVGKVKAFYRCLDMAEQTAQAHNIVTIGITPTRPETGYGYIECTTTADDDEAMGVHAFVEKPSLPLALKYLASGKYLWNAGMFFFRPGALFDAIHQHMPKSSPHLRTILEGIDTPKQDAIITEHFAHLESISIDYGVMEKAEDVWVVPAPFAWSDVGHWAALSEVKASDDADNVILGKAVTHETSDTVIYNTTDRVIAVSGLDKLVIVDTPDALLVLPKERAQDVRILVDKLKKGGHDDVL